MSLFEHPEFDDHEEVLFRCDPDCGLRAIFAIHSSAPHGFSGGGCRLRPYASDDDALHDALRLSRAMSYKLALFEMLAGGAKVVVMAEPGRDKTEALLMAIGRVVERLAGRFVIAEDMGTTAADMEVIARETSYVVRRHTDTAPATGHGVFVGLQTAVRHALGRDDLRGLRVAIQGVGTVGYHLGRRLRQAGAELRVCDVDPAAVERAVEELGARPVAPEAIYDSDVDVFAPCAVGGILDPSTIARLRCRIVAGGANNQLAHDGDAGLIAARGILFAPDFVVNAGGILGAADEVADQGRGGAGSCDGQPLSLGRIAAVLERVLERADRERLTPHAAAMAMAREKIRAQRGLAAGGQTGLP